MFTVVSQPGNSLYHRNIVKHNNNNNHAYVIIIVIEQARVHSSTSRQTLFNHADLFLISLNFRRLACQSYNLPNINARVHYLHVNLICDEFRWIETDSLLELLYCFDYRKVQVFQTEHLMDIVGRGFRGLYGV